MKSRKMILALLFAFMVMVTPSFSCMAVAPLLSVDSAVSERGAHIDLPIRMSGNPGIISLQIFIQYDTSVLTLDSVTDGGLLGSDVVQSEGISDNPYTISWAIALATANNTSNGILTTLHFKVSDAAPDQTAVRLSYSKQSTRNNDFRQIDFTTQDGTVTVITPSLTISEPFLELETRKSGTVSFTTTPAGQEVSVRAVDASHTQYSKRDSEVVFTGKSSGTDLYDLVMFYGGREYSSRITVTVADPPKIITAIEIASLPARLKYSVGETLDVSGMIVQAAYSDGSTAIVDGWICFPTTFTAEGIENITVAYCEEGILQTATFTVSVNMPRISIQNAEAEITLDYRTTIEFYANVTDPVADAQIRWFVDDQDRGSGETFTVRESKKSFTVQAKYMKDGKVLAESEIETVNVKTGFFAMLKAFFRALFGKLPKVVQEYMGAHF